MSRRPSWEGWARSEEGLGGDDDEEVEERGEVPESVDGSVSSSSTPSAIVVTWEPVEGVCLWRRVVAPVVTVVFSLEGGELSVPFWFWVWLVSLRRIDMPPGMLESLGFVLMGVSASSRGPSASGGIV